MGSRTCAQRKEAEKRARAAEREACAEWRRWQREQANLFTLDDNDDDLDPDDHPRRARKSRSTRRDRAPAWSCVSMLGRREQEAQQEAQAAARRWRQKQERLAARDAERQVAQQAPAASRRQEEATWYRQQVQARQDEAARREERTRYKAARRTHRAALHLDRPALANADEADIRPLDTPLRPASCCLSKNRAPQHASDRRNGKHSISSETYPGRYRRSDSISYPGNLARPASYPCLASHLHSREDPPLYRDRAIRRSARLGLQHYRQLCAKRSSPCASFEVQSPFLPPGVPRRCLPEPVPVKETRPC